MSAFATSTDQQAGIAPLHDPLTVPQYHALNAAIERYTADVVARDPDAFHVGSADLRYVVERRLFFALFADREWHEQYVALKTGGKTKRVDDLGPWSRLLFPYVAGIEQPPVKPPNLSDRLKRSLYRRRGKALVESEGLSGADRPVLLVILHRKFVTYLKPIAEGLRAPHAYVVVDNPELYGWLGEQGLPRIHIRVPEETLEWSRPGRPLRKHEHRPGMLDDLPLRFNGIRRALRSLRPGCVVVPEGNADVYELVNQASKQIHVQTMCIQQGWAPVVHPGFRNMSYSVMCVWGKGFAEILAPYNPRQHFVATGSHVVDRARQGDVTGRSAITFYLQNGAHMMTAATWRSMLEMIAWAARAFPHMEIRIREHPGAPLAAEELAVFMKAPNTRHMSPKTSSLTETLQGARIAVAMNSTTILEAAAAGVVPLILDVNGFGRYSPDIATRGAAVEVTDFRDAKVQLQRLILDEDYCASFATALDKVGEDFFAHPRDDALQAIITEIERRRSRQ